MGAEPLGIKNVAPPRQIHDLAPEFNMKE